MLIACEELQVNGEVRDLKSLEEFFKENGENLGKMPFMEFGKIKLHTIMTYLDLDSQTYNVR